MNHNEDNPGVKGRLATICNLMLGERITLLLPQQMLLSISFPIVCIEFSPGLCVEHRILFGLCLFLTSILQVPRKRYSPVWVKYGRFSLGSSILVFHLVLPWVGFHQGSVLLFK